MSDFLFVPRYSITNADLTVINGSGSIVDADAAVTGSFYTYANDALVFTRSAVKVVTGVYRITFSSAETATPGAYYLRYTYNLSGIAQQYQIDIEVPSSSAPLYESVSDGIREVVESVWIRFADLFDSAVGGPHLSMYAQSNFGRERITELCRIAIGRLNTIAQPNQSYSISGDSIFPVTQWGALLEQATYIEVIKHLMRSYVEQPDAQGIPSARLDRRDYLSRWAQILAAEESTLSGQLDVFKLASMNLGTPSVLVAGGVYGNLVRTTPAARPKHRMPWSG